MSTTSPSDRPPPGSSLDKITAWMARRRERHAAAESRTQLGKTMGFAELGSPRSLSADELESTIREQNERRLRAAEPSSLKPRSQKIGSDERRMFAAEITRGMEYLCECADKGPVDREAIRGIRAAFEEFINVVTAGNSAGRYVVEKMYDAIEAMDKQRNGSETMRAEIESAKRGQP